MIANNNGLFSLPYLQENDLQKADQDLIICLKKEGIEGITRLYSGFDAQGDNVIALKALEIFRRAIVMQCTWEGTSLEELQVKIVDIEPKMKSKMGWFARKKTPVKVISPVLEAYKLFVVRVLNYSTGESMIDSSIHGYFELAKKFHANGVKLDIATLPSKVTLLNYSVSGDHHDFSKWLIANKAPVNIAELINGRTPLHTASLRGHAVIVAALLDAGANPDVPDTLSGNTSLHLACSKFVPTKIDRAKAARLALYLVTRGGNPSIENIEKKKPNEFINEQNLKSGFKIWLNSTNQTLKRIPSGVRYMIYSHLTKGELLTTMRINREWSNTIVQDVIALFQQKSKEQDPSRV